MRRTGLGRYWICTTTSTSYDSFPNVHGWTCTATNTHAIHTLTHTTNENVRKADRPKRTRAKSKTTNQPNNQPTNRPTAKQMKKSRTPHSWRCFSDNWDPKRKRTKIANELKEESKREIIENNSITLLIWYYDQRDG